MAVKDDGFSYPTEAIVSKRLRKHYRIPVRSQHWQLRSLISAEKKHFVYFPGGHGSNHVQRLNTRTHEYETIRHLSFAPRCLVGEKGWVCCGSEHGDFVAIRLDEPDNGIGGSSYIDPDARLSLNLDSSRDEPISAIAAHIRRQNKNLIAKSMKLAKDRVNCITLWFPPTTEPACDMAYTEPVAVLANNDRTVTIVSLRDFDQNEKTEPLAVITYPDYVNRAIISPDGSMLIAILDDPYLYVHERAGKLDAFGPARYRDKPEYQWLEKQRLLLKSQRKDDRSDSRGSFAACFSSSGAYLAVGTQHGTISIFDATLLTDLCADPLLTTFTSSRPQSGPGAVRDMAFSPGPYDVLAWTEDRGHIGIADMRTNFVARQVVDINAESDFDHINILDRNTIDPRLLESRSSRRDTDRRDNDRRDSDRRARNTGTTSFDDHQRQLMLLENENRNRLERARMDRAAVNRPFTAHELSLIEAVRDRRSLRGPGAQRDTTATGRNADDVTQGIAEISWSNLSNLRPSAGDPDSSRSRERSSSVSRALGLLGRGDQRERNLDRVRSTRQLLLDSSDSAQAARRTDQQWLDLMSETVASVREQRERQDSSYLNVLEILQGRDPDTERDDTSLLAPLTNTANSWQESAIRGTLPGDAGVFEVPPSPDNTAGLAWSDDGRTLFIGAQNGIYELHLNVYARKFSPSITTR